MTGLDSRGRNIVIGTDHDSNPEWLGMKASDLLLLAAASCSAYDEMKILKKQREPVDNLEISCTGEQNSDAPYTCKSVTLNYIIKGRVDQGKLERAIELSEEKYCSVISTLKPAVKITSSYEIIKLALSCLWQSIDHLFLEKSLS
jgi:putative redox protein